MVIVNEGVITESELKREMGLAEMELRTAGRPIPPRDLLAGQLLEDLIIDRILLEIAVRLHITASDEQVKYALSTIANQNRLTSAQLRQTIEQTGVGFDDYLDDLRKQLIIRQLINREISRKVNVTAAEIQERLARDPQLSAPVPVEFELAHILLKLPTNASETEVANRQKLAQEIRQRIVAGLPFAQAAKRYSQGAEASRGGLIGWRGLEQLPSLFLTELQSVAVGDMSGVFRSANGWHLLKLLGRRGGSETIVIQREVRHILVRPSTFLAPTQLQARLERIRARILGGEDFGVVARLQSEDANTRALGGSFGWLSPGELPTEFEQVLDVLALGEVSPVFQTGAGWHIAEITGERQADLGDAVRRRRAEQAVRAGKTEEAFEQWTQLLREESFVQYRVRPGE